MAPVTPRDAATVMLLRPAPGGGRKAAPASAAWPCTCSGGGRRWRSRRARTCFPAVLWTPPTPTKASLGRPGRRGVGPAAWRACRTGADPGLRGRAGDVRGIRCAAGRARTPGPCWPRPAMRNGRPTAGKCWPARCSLAELLRRRGLVLRSDLLRPWARWITPETEARRYDTRFFAAALPDGQRARDVSGEADETAWLEPAAALEAASRSEISLFPPPRSRSGSCGHAARSPRRWPRGGG